MADKIDDDVRISKYISFIYPKIKYGCVIIYNGNIL